MTRSSGCNKDNGLRFQAAKSLLIDRRRLWPPEVIGKLFQEPQFGAMRGESSGVNHGGVPPLIDSADRFHSACKSRRCPWFQEAVLLTRARCIREAKRR